MAQATSPRPSRQKCPLCARPAHAPYAPFCGQGCRDRDLLNWLGDNYRVPGPPADEGAADYPPRGLDSEA